MPIKEGGLPKIAYAQKREREGRERDAKKRDSERRR